MADPALLAKAQMIRRCVQRAREEYAAAGDFRTDFTRQDAAILNVERACQGAIAMANRVVALRDLGTPNSSAETCNVLATAGGLSDVLADAMRRMVGFRNIAVHAYHELEIALVERVIRRDLTGLLKVAEVLLDA